MDGPSSKTNAAPVNSGTNSDRRTPHLVSSHQSIKELVSSMTSHHNAFMDPPRPAKEGYEWVWFPAGYWAEREIAEPTAKDSTRTFSWRKRSGKSSSESAKNSPQLTMQHSLTSSTVSEKTEKSPDQAIPFHSGHPTTTSDGSNVSPFTANRMSDAHPPSPYLSEEAHVQSLQHPTMENSTRHRHDSWSAGSNSMFKQHLALFPSPLHLTSSETEGDPDWLEFSNTGRQAQPDRAHEAYPRIMAGGPPLSKVKAKRSLINWRMLAEHRQTTKKRLSVSDETVVIRRNPEALSPPSHETASSLRKNSSKSEESDKLLKSKFFSKSRWQRKFSNSSKSTSSSIHNSVRSQSPCPTPFLEKEELTAVKAWNDEFPGNEATRVLVPHAMGDSLDRFPRSFFADLPASMANHLPLSRQEGQQKGQRKSHLSTTFTAVDSSSSTTPRARPTDSGSDKRTTTSSKHKNGSGQSTATTLSKPERPASRGPTRKEWWEVPPPPPRPVSRPNDMADQRHRHAVMAAESQRAFQFDLPEHLPTSPMCPANKRHKSGGTGVCVYHGRAKQRRTASSEDTSIGGSSMDGGRCCSQGSGSDTGSDVWK